MTFVLIIILVVLLFSIIELNITQEMTINFVFFTIGPFPVFYFIIAALLIGALCMVPTTLRYYSAYKKAIHIIKKRDKEAIKFETEDESIDF